MQESPYQPPQAPLATASAAAAPDGVRLYRESGILLATLFCGIAAGALLLGINAQRLGQPGVLWRYLGCGLAATVVVIIASLVLPQAVPALTFNALQLLLIRYVLRRTQGATLAAHADNIGAFESNWKAVGLAVLVLIALWTVVYGGILAYDVLTWERA